jgi:NAD(P)H dehydrogenase (quinone)
MYGHVEKLAQEIKKGAESIECVEAKPWQVCKSIIRTNKVSIIL